MENHSKITLLVRKKGQKLLRGLDFIVLFSKTVGKLCTCLGIQHLGLIKTYFKKKKNLSVKQQELRV